MWISRCTHLKCFAPLLCIVLVHLGCSSLENKANNLVLFKGLSFVGAPEIPSAQDMDSVVQTSANAISLMPFAFLNSKEQTIQYLSSDWQWKGESQEGIETAIRLAQERQIQCMIKPQLWIDEGTFTGYFQLDNEEAWQRIEKDYTDFILRFAEISQRYNLPLFCIATELDQWAKVRPQFWQELIAKIKQTYTGKLVYACNWDGAHKIPFWSSLDYIGVDAYHPLSAQKTPTIAQLLLAWDSIDGEFEQLYARHKKPIIFTEWGYQACDFPTKEPWIEDSSILTNELAQSNCYEALWLHCSQQEWFAGGFVWKWFPPQGQEPSQVYERYSPQGRAAEQTLRKIFQNLP
jgi:hypothetical protein